MSRRVLITGPAILATEAAQLEALGFEVVNGTEAALRLLSVPEGERQRDLTEAETAALLQDVAIYIYGGLEVASARVLEGAKELKLIAFLGTGWSDQGCVDAAAVERLRIPVTNTPGANAPSVAELAIAFVLALQRRIVPLNNQTKTGNGRPIKLNDIAGRTLGIVGIGKIGSLVARHGVLGFGMKVVYSGPHAKPNLEKELGVRRAELDDLLHDSDFVTLHCPALTTVGLIGTRELSRMRKDAFLINVSSPEVVDGPAIVEALESGKIAGAAYDGWYKQPADLQRRFLAIPDERLLVSPRTAWLTQDSYSRMLQMTLESIKAQLSNSRPTYQVNL